MISAEFRMMLLRIRDPHDRAMVRAHELLSHQEEGAAARGGSAHRRLMREVDALARSIENGGRLGAAADGGLLSERAMLSKGGGR